MENTENVPVDSVGEDEESHDEQNVDEESVTEVCAMKMEESDENVAEDLDHCEVIDPFDRCLVCLDNKCNVEYLPCGHIVSCSSCDKIRLELYPVDGFEKCFICRRYVDIRRIITEF